MSKKLLSITLALALLLGALSCGFVAATADVTAPEAIDKGGYTIQTVADKETAYAEWLTGITGRSNTLSNLIPKIYATINANGGMDGDPASSFHTYCPNANAAFLYDGLTPGINATIDNGTTTNKKVFWSTTGYPYLFVDLEGQIQLDQLLLTAAVGEGSFGTVSIYAGADAATLVTDDNLVAQESNFFGAVITLKQAITARYVAIHFTGSMARVSELGIYSATPKATIRDGYTLQSFSDKATGDAAYLSGILGRTNLLSGVSYTLYTAADFSTTASFGNGSKVAALTDGNISGTTDSATSSSKVFWGNAATSYLFYDFGGNATIDQLLMASSTGEGTQSIKIYAGNDKATLLNDENLIVNESNLFTGVFTLNKAVQVRYLVFIIAGASNYARVSELAAYSDLPVSADRDGYTLVSLPDKATAHAEWLTGIMSRHNQLAGLTPKLYKEAALTTAGNPSGTVSFMTDANIPGTTDSSTSNGSKAFWNAATYPYLYYDLGGTIQLNQLLLGSSIGEGSQKLVVYASNSPENLISDDNIIVDETAVFTAVVTMDTPVSARYLAFNIVGTSNYARVSELGVYGEYREVQSLGAQIRGANDADTYALRFAFSIAATGIDYASDESYDRAELTNASKMVIDGVERQVVDFGAIVSKDNVDADQLVADCNGSTIKMVPALKLYDVTDGVVTFTAVVTNVPASYAGSALSTRPYVAYLDDNGQTAYYYGDKLARSVNDVKDAASLS